MLKRLIPLLVLLTGAALLVIPSSAQATPNHTITMHDYYFQPKTLPVSQGDTVTWTNMTPIPHTATSNQKFWNSGDVNQGTPYNQHDVFLNAGTYAYHCTYHQALGMVGTIRVLMIKAPAATGGYTIRWSSASTAPANRNFDVQIKRPNSSAWQDFKMATTKLSAHFAPTTTGLYHFQARTRNTSNGRVSGYSPPLSVTI